MSTTLFDNQQNVLIHEVPLPMNIDELESTVKSIVSDDRGILAADGSSLTLKKVLILFKWNPQKKIVSADCRAESTSCE